MVIGSISFTSTRSQSINQLNTNSFHNNDLVNQANSSVGSASQKAAGKLPVASDKSFDLAMINTSYVDPISGQLYSAGRNDAGTLGLGFTGNQATFTPIFKSGDKAQPFIDPIDWEFDNIHGAIIDADGKLWTSGAQIYGALGNGIVHTESYNKNTQNQFETENLIGLPTGYKAIAVNTAANTNTIVMLDNGDIYGAGECNALGLSGTGGVNLDGTDGGRYYPTFTKLNDVMSDAGLDPSKIVEFEAGSGATMYLLDDGSLWRASSSGYEQVGTDVTSFDINGQAIYYTTSNGDVYYATNATSAFTKILSKTDDSVPSYVGDIKEVYSMGYSPSSWTYLTIDGDVYYCNTNGYIDGESTFTKIAQDVVYFDMGGHSDDVTFGAITKDGQFKLWGDDRCGMLGNGDNAGATPGWDQNNPSIDAFLSEDALVTTPTTDGTQVTPPQVDEDGNLKKDENGNNIPIDTTLASPAPA